MPRVQQLTAKSDVGEDQYAEIDRITEVLGGVGPGPFSILLHSPGLAQKVMEAGAQVRLGSTLDPVEREIAIISVCREKDASHEWNGHVNTGRRQGMREEVIEAVRNRADVSSLAEDERDIVTFVRQRRLVRIAAISSSLTSSFNAIQRAGWWSSRRWVSTSTFCDNQCL